MALMFPRLARNFIKNGYYPTDEITLDRIVKAITPRACAGTIRLFDPCAGEGVALAECKAYLASSGNSIVAYAIEYDAERAQHAKRLIDRCIKGSFYDAVVSPRAFGLLFLNPPYGDKVADKAGTGDASRGKQRLETEFLQRSLHHLQFGGVLVLIVPYYILKGDLALTLAKYFEHIRVFMAPEQQFKQAVIFAVRKRAADNPSQIKTRCQDLEAIAAGALPPELPEHVWAEPYVIPTSVTADIKFTVAHIDPEQLQEEINRSPCLWPQFELHFGSVVTVHRNPLRPLSPWHLALALAAGQVSGVVTAEDGRIYVIKGDTHKEKVVTVDIEADGDQSREVRTATDRFMPMIRALDLTPNSATYGNTIAVR